MNATSHVTAGENGGRTLAHQFIAMNLTRTDLNQSKDSFGAEVSCPTDRADALAVWVTLSGSLVPIQATGGVFPLSFAVYGWEVSGYRLLFSNHVRQHPEDHRSMSILWPVSSHPSTA